MLKEHARRSGVAAEQQAKILMCVTHSRRPLRLIELGSLLARMLGVTLRRGKDLVRAGCGRLLELLEDETVSVIHHSFTEFLHDVSRKDDKNAFPVLEDDPSHAALAVLLLEYLSGCPHFDAALDDNRETDYEEPTFYETEKERREKIRTKTRINHPLVSYAVDTLMFHIGKTTPGPPADRLLAALDRYLAPGQPAFETWMLMTWLGPLSASFSVFHLIASAKDGGLIPLYVVEHVVEREPALLDGHDSEGFTPLGYAAKLGHEALAGMLLLKGADTTSGGGRRLTPLHWAAQEGNTGVARLLLDAGIDPLIKSHPVLSEFDHFGGYWLEYTEEEAERRRETALSCAFRGGNNEVVKTFIPFIPPDEINLCFHKVDGLENIKAILETGKVNVDCFGNGETRLFHAARFRNAGLIRLLLQYGADPNKRCDWDPAYYDDEITITMELSQEPDGALRPTPLHAFVGVGYSRMVLLDRGKEEAAECLRLLLEAGGDVDAIMDERFCLNQSVTPLHYAVQHVDTASGVHWGSMDKTEMLLTELLLLAGADANAKTKNGDTPLHLANPEKPGLLEILAEHGADINAVNIHGRTPLLEMINRLGHGFSNKPRPGAQFFDRLLELGADVMVADYRGDNIFHHILHSITSFTDPAFAPFIEKLLRAGADLNGKNKKGELPLLKYKRCSNRWSSDHGLDEELLRFLVNAGMDLDARDEKGRTILWEIGGRYDSEVKTMEMFVRLGADLGALSNDGLTLLHSAVAKSRPPEWFRYLISAGLRADTLNKDWDSIIHTMARLRHPHGSAREVFQLLVEAGAVPLAKNGTGQSVLHVAGSLKTLKHVLNTREFKGLDVNDPDVDGFTPLHNAAALGEEAVGALLRAGADPTALTVRSLSPLHVAARSGEANVVELLLARYRELNVLEKHVDLLGEGRGALHYACRSGVPEAVRALLRSGADPWLTDEKGLTPLYALTECEPWGTSLPLRRLRGPPEIVGMLQRAGVDLTAEAVVWMGDETAPRALTPLDAAVEKKRWEMARELIAGGAEPGDDYSQSEEFALGTDKNRAAEEAREAQARVPRRQSTSRRGRGRGWGRCWRGRWAACPGPAMVSLEEDTCFITNGQDVLDAKIQNVDGDACDQVSTVEILNNVLEDGDYNTLKEYAQLGGNLLERSGHHASTILHTIVGKGHTDLLEYFGDKVAKLETQEWVQDSGSTLLATACARELPSLHIVKLLADKIGLSENAVHSRPSYWSPTALHTLATGAHFWQIEALNYLLTKRAAIEARDRNGLTPLLTATDTKHPDGFWCEETVRVLLRHGADVNAAVTGDCPRRGRSALEMSGRPGITKLLLENGASTETCPALLTHIIREWMEPGLVKVLLEAGLDPNKPPPKHHAEIGEGETDAEFRYPLHEASRPTTIYDPDFDSQTRQQAIIDLLISHGADAYAPYADGGFVLQAIVEDRCHVGPVLLQLSKTNCNRSGRSGRTLLVSACVPAIPAGPPVYSREKPRPTIMADLIHTLLDLGADTLAVDDEGRTPLHWLSTFPGPFDESYSAAFAALARQGPEAVTKTDNQGRTPFHLALATYAARSQLFSPFVIRHLLSLGADPTKPDPLTGNTAAHYVAQRLVGESAAAEDTAALFRELVTRGDIDINARNAAGETPAFSLAMAEWGPEEDSIPKVWHYEVLDVLVELGANIMAVDARGRTLLHVTAGREVQPGEPGRSWRRDLSEDIVKTFKRLLELGVDPRAEDDELRTAIDVAVAMELRGVVLLFSEEGKRIEERMSAIREEAKKKEEEEGGKESGERDGEEPERN